MVVIGLAAREVFAYIVQETKKANISLDGVTSPYWADQGISHRAKNLACAVDLESDTSSDEAEPRGGVAPASGSTAGIAPDSGSVAGAATSAASGGDDGDRVPSLPHVGVAALVDRYLYIQRGLRLRWGLLHSYIGELPTHMGEKPSTF